MKYKWKQRKIASKGSSETVIRPQKEIFFGRKRYNKYFLITGDITKSKVFSSVHFSSDNN